MAKFTFANNEIIAISSTLKTFGVPGVDINKIIDRTTVWSAHSEEYKYRWGVVVMNNDGISIDIDTDITAKVINDLETFAPYVGAALSMVSFLKPFADLKKSFCSDLKIAAKGFAQRWKAAVADKIMHYVYDFDWDGVRYIVLLAENEYGTKHGLCCCMHGNGQVEDAELFNMKEALWHIDHYNVEPVATEERYLKTNKLSDAEVDTAFDLLHAAVRNTTHESFKAMFEKYHWSTVRECITSDVASLVLSKLQDEKASNDKATEAK